MADHKQDFTTASMSTGRHRAWVGETLGVKAPARAPQARDAVRNWPAKQVPPVAGKGNARHAAITKSLANFPSYKTWAEKTKANWQDENPE